MITLDPTGPLSLRLDRALLAVDTAQDQLFDVSMHDVARLVRDALPTASELVIDTNDLYVPPIGVVLHAIYGDGTILWERDGKPSEALATYQTGDGTTWPDVVRHLERELTSAMGTESPGMWWEPRDDRGEDGFYIARLPAVEEVAAIQDDQPQLLAAYVADRDALPYRGLWHAQPVPCPTMSVAGVALTASLGDDGVLTVDIDPTGTAPKVIGPVGPGTAVRIRFHGTVVHQSAAAPAQPAEATA